MKHVVRSFAGSLTLLLVALLAFTTVAEACGGWHVDKSPNASVYNNSLQAVAAVSPRSVYAVGYFLKEQTKSSLLEQTLIEHFNGTRWSVMASPNVGTGNNELKGIVAISSTDLYAVGTSGAGGPLIEHFNGIRWSVVNLSSPCATLNAVAADSARDVWAVGITGGTTGDIFGKTCIEHFNGHSWSRVPSPSPGTSDDTLNGVTALSSGNAWAVGDYCVGGGCDRGGGIFQTLVEHFNGSRWSVVASPNPGPMNSLSAVTAISANNIYTVGGYNPANTPPGTSDALIEHYNGSRWSVIASPRLKGNSTLTGIAANSAHNIYAVGSASIPTAPAYPTLIEHFNGTNWSIVSSPSPGTSNVLNGVVSVPASNQFYAVGNYSTNNSPALTLIESNC